MDDSVLIKPEILEVLSTEEGLELLDHLMKLSCQENSNLHALNSCLWKLWRQATNDVKDKLVELVFRSREVKHFYLEKWKWDLKNPFNEGAPDFYEGASAWKRKQEQEEAKNSTTTATTNDKIGLLETTVTSQRIYAPADMQPLETPPNTILSIEAEKLT